MCECHMLKQEVKKNVNRNKQYDIWQLIISCKHIVILYVNEKLGITKEIGRGR